MARWCSAVVRGRRRCLPYSRWWLGLAFGLVIASHARAASEVTQLTPQNIDQQDYTFSIEARKAGDAMFFNVSIEPKANAYWTDHIGTTLMLGAGGKQIMQCEVQSSRQGKRVVVSQFSVASESLANSKFRFAIMAESNGRPEPGGLFFWFALNDFSGTDKAALVGKWRFDFDNGRSENRELRPDGTFINLAEDMTRSADGKVYHWEAVGRDLILTLAGGEKEDFSLPLDPKGAKGRDSDGLKLLATKLAAEPEAGKTPYAIPVLGKPGFVISPYDKYKGYIDVRGFPPNTEVKDPYSGKSFLVP